MFQKPISRGLVGFIKYVASIESELGMWAENIGLLGARKKCWIISNDLVLGNVELFQRRPG